MSQLSSSARLTTSSLVLYFIWCFVGTVQADDSTLSALAESFGTTQTNDVQTIGYEADGIVLSDLFDSPFSDAESTATLPVAGSGAANAETWTLPSPTESLLEPEGDDAPAESRSTAECQDDLCGAQPYHRGRGHCLGKLCSCRLGEAWSLGKLLHGDCPPPITLGGWLSAGYHTKSNGLFNDRADELAVHQGWLFAEKLADGCSSHWGFRIDVMYGIDATDTQAFGNPGGSWDFQNGLDRGAYGWAIPQAYGEVACGDWSVKVGHFYTLVGYEVVTAPDNFFYSHAMTMYNSEPFTHTGVLATHSKNGIDTFFGWTLGWDTGFDQLNQGNSWLGGLSLALSEDAQLTYVSTAGNLGWRGDDGHSYSVVLDTSLTNKLNWVLQSDLVRVDSTGEDNVGINNYLLYAASECLGIGTRVEWWKGDVLTGYAPHGATLPASGSLSYYAATFGVNYRPHANLVFRPEARIDWSPAANYDETYFGVDAIFTF